MCSLVSIYWDIPHLVCNKTKLHKALGYWSREMLNFDFLEKSLGIVSPSHFVHDLLRKMFLMLYSINWPNFIVWLFLLVEILVNMCTGIRPVIKENTVLVVAAHQNNIPTILWCVMSMKLNIGNELWKNIACLQTYRTNV